jgi:Domain of unknown function (DUF4129)
VESRRGTILTTLGVLVALGVVALAARGGVETGSPGSRRPADGLLDVAFSLFLVALALGVVAIVLLFYLNRDALRALPEPIKRRQRSRRTVLIVLASVLALALVVRSLGERQGQLELPGLQPLPPADATPPGEAADERYVPEFAWLPVLIVVALASAGVAAAWWSAKARRRALGDGNEPTLAEALDDVLAETLDDLRAEADPRRAVIGAYARLERALAAYGVPRRPAEAPLEYLGRTLAEAEVGPVAVKRLTLLFERARFSQHEVDVMMKDEAIEALETVREDLRLAELRAQQARAEALAFARERAEASG